MKHWKVTTIILALSLLLTGLVAVGSLWAQLKKEEVDFEVLDTVTMKSGDALWNLAIKYYKDPLKWKYIAEMNKIPNERRIPVGTVIYIPVADAKKIVKEAEKEVAEKKVVLSELELKLQEALKELEQLKKDYEACVARSKELSDALDKKNAIIADLEAKIKSLTDELEAQAELEEQLEDMRAAAKAAAEGKAELSEALKEKEIALAEKEARLAEMERQLGASKEEIARLESAIKELNAKLEAAAKPPAPKRVSEPRSRIAAMAIALVGSIIWMASSK